MNFRSDARKIGGSICCLLATYSASKAQFVAVAGCTQRIECNLQCLDAGYIIALEAQLFLVGLLLVFLASRRRRIARLSLTILILVSLGYIALIVYRYELFATLLPTKNVEE